MNRQELISKLAHYRALHSRGNIKESTAMIPDMIEYLLEQIEGPGSEVQVTELPDGRKLFYVDVGDLSPDTAKAKLDELKQRFEQPARKSFYIDVGDLPPETAVAKVREIITEVEGMSQQRKDDFLAGFNAAMNPPKPSLGTLVDSELDWGPDVGNEVIPADPVAVMEETFVPKKAPKATAKKPAAKKTATKSKTAAKKPTK